MAVTPQTASFPLPAPAAGLPIINPDNGHLSTTGLDLFSRLWAGVQGTNGLTDQVSTAQSQITGLTTQMGNFYAAGLFRVSVHASLNGADATIAISAAASSGGSAVTAAIFLSAFTSTGKGQIILQGDQIYATADGLTFVQLFGTATTNLNFSGVVANGAVLTQHIEDFGVTDYAVGTNGSIIPSGTGTDAPGEYYTGATGGYPTNWYLLGTDFGSGFSTGASGSVNMGWNSWGPNAGELTITGGAIVRLDLSLSAYNSDSGKNCVFYLKIIRRNVTTDTLISGPFLTQGQIGATIGKRLTFTFWDLYPSNLSPNEYRVYFGIVEAAQGSPFIENIDYSCQVFQR